MSRHLRLSVLCLVCLALSLSMVAQVLITPNDYFAEIGRMAPGFGGIFVDESADTIYAYMVNGGPDSLAFVDRALTDVLGSDRPPQHRLQLLPGQYTFLQLKEWHDRMSPLILAIPGTVQTGIDHWTNRLEIGVESLSITPQVEAVLDELGVPREAVNIEEMPTHNLELLSGPIGPVAGETQDISNDEISNDAMCVAPCTLQSYIRPVVGGIQIQADDQGLCTLGFVATVPETRGIGIVTNSHCTRIQGGSEGTLFFQPRTLLGTNQVARELNNGARFFNRKGDPCYFRAGGGVYPAGCTPAPPLLPGCPANTVCRRSDSSFSALQTVSGGNITSLEGYIAQPTMMSPTPCLPPGYVWDGAGMAPAACVLAWNGAPAPVYFRIVGEVVVPLSGRTVNKVGRTTGWTQGTVNAVCVNVKVASANNDGQIITQICQNQANYMSSGGDSGSPAFVITNSPAQNDVRIVGIHFAGTCRTRIVMGTTHITCNPRIPTTSFSPIGRYYRVSGGVQDIPFELGPLLKCAVVPGRPPC